MRVTETRQGHGPRPGTVTNTTFLRCEAAVGDGTSAAGGRDIDVDGRRSITVPITRRRASSRSEGPPALDGSSATAKARFQQGWILVYWAAGAVRWASRVIGVFGSDDRPCIVGVMPRVRVSDREARAWTPMASTGAAQAVAGTIFRR